MYCSSCHNGSSYYSPQGIDYILTPSGMEPHIKCPQCGKYCILLEESPFPKHPTGMGRKPYESKSNLEREKKSQKG